MPRLTINLPDLPKSPHAGVLKKLGSARAARVKRTGQGFATSIRKLDTDARSLVVHELQTLHELAGDWLLAPEEDAEAASGDDLSHVYAEAGDSK